MEPQNDAVSSPLSSALPSPLASPSPAAPLALLAAGCTQLGLALDGEQLRQFEQYYQELVTWNERLNLTTITGYEEVQVKHFLDSLVSLPLLAEELGLPLSLRRAGDKPLRVVDVGSGAGFPGLPFKIAAPQVEMTLMDGTQKKVHFLTEIIERLGLAATYVVHGRAEELGRKPEHRDRYDIVTARAVAPLNVLAEYLLPLVRPGGLAVIYKGPGAPQEFMEARQAIKLLAADAVRLAPVEVPYLAEKRFVLLLKKLRPTPSQYPRGQGLARKRPL
jgi:16S rRNA (guanine527-N7)-methyltransferase